MLLLSKEYGVNSTLLCCPLCGADTGVGLLGHNKGKEAPRRSRDVRPCDDCAGHMAKGVLLIETVESPTGRLTTGRLVVVRPEAVGRMFDEATAARVLKCGAAHVDREAFVRLGLAAACGGEVPL